MALVDYQASLAPGTSKDDRFETCAAHQLLAYLALVLLVDMVAGSLINPNAGDALILVPT